MIQRTLAIIKGNSTKGDRTDWIQIINIYQDAGLEIKRARILAPMTLHMARELCKEHKGKGDYYRHLIRFYVWKNISIALWIEGENAIKKVREINGATDPKEAKVGTIRYLFGKSKRQNSAHASADEESSDRELPIFFPN